MTFRADAAVVGWLMANCSVLRCPRPANRPFIHGGSGGHEWPVCDDHGARLERGEDFCFLEDELVILMGADLHGEDILFVTKVESIEVDASHLSGDLRKVTFENNDGSAGHLSLTSAALSGLRRLIEEFEVLD